MDYKDTLLMPKTNFQMRGNLGVREIEFQKKWEQLNIYEKNLAMNKDNQPFILHDGPPYANGNIHIGHAFQKTLKDFVLRFKTMRGFYTPYIPGWDTHGLPIENEVTKKGVDRKTIERHVFLDICKQFALEQVEKQKAQFMRLGILGDWHQPYITLDNRFVSNQIEAFATMVEKGYIYRGLKPVYWSPTSESALAEAEIEYQDKQSFSIYFGFDVLDEPYLNTKLLIWTTTPWTLPGNLAVSVHPNLMYAHILADGKKYIVLHTLLNKIKDLLSFKEVKVLSTFAGETLENLHYKHALFDRVSPIILGEHVTDLDGTGLVHTAPGHGEDDYIVGKKYQLDILAPIDDKGVLTKEAHQFAGLFYEKANQAIIDALKDVGALFRVDQITHSYPHDWRTHKPVIFRATPQWFFSIEKIKDQVLQAVDEVTWHPSWGKVRMNNMMKDRGDWCISRQRAWGVPIPVFYREDKTPILDPTLMRHVAKIFLERGSNYWYEASIDQLVNDTYQGLNLTKEMDIMDVWFDSGTSFLVLDERHLPFPADLYLEGSDQYRGWFNSSLICSLAAKNQKPYQQIVSHGFVLDGQGRKMSKSLGNVIDPLKVIQVYGADILRLWVSSVAYQSDVRISDDMLKQISEAYRKIRNTLRFIQGNLFDFNPQTDYVGFSMRGQLNRMMTINYLKTEKAVIDSYDNYEFDRIYRVIMPFIINDVSAFYLDYTKDILYIEKANDFERRSVQSTLYDILMGLLKILNPILPHTTSECYWESPYPILEDIYLERILDRSIPQFPELENAFGLFMELRLEALKQLELAREEKIIGKSLQANLVVLAPKHYLDAIDYLDIKLHQVLMVSKVKLQKHDTIKVTVTQASGHTCERCWNVVDTINENGLCPRCQKVLEE